MKKSALVVGALIIVSILSSGLGQTILTAISGPELMGLVNRERIEQNVEPLVENEDLAEAAQDKAEYMAKRGFFSHSTPEGIPFWFWLVKHGYQYLYSGENLAVKFFENEAIVNAWMHSEGHKRNILDDRFVETGIGIATGIYKGVETQFVVQLFGKKKVEQNLDTEQ